MKTYKIPILISILAVAGILLFSGCTSITLLQTVPDGAKVYVNDELGGETPFTMVDNKIIGTSTVLRFEKPGYKSFSTVISKTEEIDPGPIVCGFIFTPVWWLWAMKYKPVHTYELVPEK
jgi:hypothetical protein